MSQPDYDDQCLETAVNEALALASQGKLREAEQRIQRLLETHPFSPFPHFAMGVVRAFQKKFDAAVNAFDAAICRDPGYIEAHFNKAVAHKEQFDLAGMTHSLQQVVKIGRFDDGLVVQARLLLDDLAKSILESHDADLETYLSGNEIFNRAFSLMEKKEWEKARVGFSECTKKLKNHYQSYGNMGMCLAMLGQKAKALDALEEALRINPAYEPAANNIRFVKELRDGEKPLDQSIGSVDYGKEQFLKNKR